MEVGPGGWRSLTAGLLEQETPDPAMRARIDIAGTRDFVAATIDLSGRMIARMQSASAVPGAGSIILVVPHDGTIHVTAGQAGVTAQPGDVLMLGTEQDCVIEAADLRMRLVCLPEISVPSTAPAAASRFREPICHDGTRGAVAVFAAMVDETCEREWRMRADRLDMLGLLGNAIAVLDRQSSAIMPDRQAMQSATSPIDDFLRDNIADPAIGAAAIARFLGVSQATVSRRFARDGGVAAYVRGFRLDSSLEYLLRKDRDKEPVGAVASRFGFSDRSVFSRAFRRRFGFSPVDVTKQQPDLRDIARRAARKAASVASGGEASGNPVNLYQWMTRNAVSALLHRAQGRENAK